MAPYLLACLHNGDTYDNNEFGDLTTSLSKGILSSEREYKGKISDCDYYVNLNVETGITGMLDYGGNVH